MLKAATSQRHTRLRDYGAFQTEKRDEQVPSQSAQTMVMPLREALSITSSLAAIPAVLPPPSVPLPMPGFPFVKEVSARMRAITGRHAVPPVQVARQEGAGRPQGIAPTGDEHGIQQGDAGTAVAAPRSSHASRKKLFSLLGRIAFTVVLFFFLARSLSWGTLLNALGKVQHTQLLVGLSVGGFGIVISSYQWRSLLNAERIRSDLASLIDLYLVGIAFSHFLPTGMGGDAVKALYVGRDAGNSTGSTSAVIMSRVTGFFGMLLLAFPVLLIWHNHFQPAVIIGFALLSLLVGVMIGTAMLCAIFLPKLARNTMLRRIPMMMKVLDKVTQVGEALYITIRRPRFLSVATLFGLQFWVIGCLNYYCYATALGIHVPFYFYCIAIPFVSLVTFLPISINGFGVRESTFVFIFSTIHVSATNALLLALLMDAQVLFFGIVGGCLYLKMGKKR